MVWAMGLDDFKGNCGEGKYPLLQEITNVLKNEEDCKRATKLDMEFIGKRYINVVPVSRAGFEKELQDLIDTVKSVADSDWQEEAGKNGSLNSFPKDILEHRRIVKPNSSTSP